MLSVRNYERVAPLAPVFPFVGDIVRRLLISAANVERVAARSPAVGQGCGLRLWTERQGSWETPVPLDSGSLRVYPHCTRFRAGLE